MANDIRRRDVLKMAGVGTLVFVASLEGISRGAGGAQGGFTFVQISDTHVGFADAVINPDYAGTLKKVIAGVNAMETAPDFVIFTGDLSHTTDDAAERKNRLNQFRDIVAPLSVKDQKFMPGEHDAGLDNGAVWHDLFGKSIYTFDHKGVHFIVLDNVSDPKAALGDDQLVWLSSDLKNLDKDARIVVFTHRPLFDLYPQWDWATLDGAKALDLLTPYSNAAVFYGHIHQENDHVSGHIPFHAARSTMYVLPPPGGEPTRERIPWDPAHPYRGLGYRGIQATQDSAEYALTEFDVAAAKETSPRVVKIQAKRYEFVPSEITLKIGVPAVLELTSLDLRHGFKCPGLSLRADVDPGKVSKLSLTPKKTGVFEFFCDIYCGSGHADMRGRIIVTD